MVVAAENDWEVTSTKDRKTKEDRIQVLEIAIWRYSRDFELHSGELADLAKEIEEKLDDVD